MIVFLFVSLLEFVAFKPRDDAIIQNAINNKKEIIVDSSGSIGQYIRGKCQKTRPNYTIVEDKKLDWCSNVIYDKKTGERPWISFALPNERMKINSYSLRTGCCWYACCCIDENTFINDGYTCCCDLYSFSLYGSNDNTTWQLLHRVEKKATFNYCETHYYDVISTDYYRYVKLVQDEERPSCPFCMQINQIEFYGHTSKSLNDYSFGESNEDESVSIIGKVKKAGE